MNFHYFTGMKLRSRFIFFVGMGLIMALFWGNGSKLSWAAPEQNPHLQTVPPRPTETPGIVPTPTQAAAQPTRPSRDEEDEDENDNEAPETDDNEGEDNTQPGTGPTGPTESDDNDPSSPAGSAQPGDKTQTQAKPSGQGSGQGNKGSVVPATPQQADLSLLKWVNNLTPEVGETITFTTLVSNSGPSRVTNVIVKDQLPPGLVLSSTFGSRGSYEAGKGHWVINTIGQNKIVTMSLVVRVTESLSTTITAEVVAVDQFDPDSTPNNHLEIEDDQTSVALSPLGGAALAVQADNSSTSYRATPLPTKETLALSADIDWLYWLGAIIVGIVFVFTGIQMVHRS